MKTFVLGLIFFSQFSFAEVISGEATFEFPLTTPNAENWASIPWTGLALDSGVKTINPSFQSANWDFRVKSGYVSTNGGEVFAIKDAAYSSITRVPNEALFSKDAVVDGVGPAPVDTYNGALMKWLQYVMTGSNGCSHIFGVSEDRYVFILKTKEGRYAKIKFIDSVKERLRVKSVTGIFGKCENVSEPESVYAKDKVYIKVQYSVNTKPGYLDLE